MGLGSAIHALAAQLTWLDPSTAADLPMLARSLPVEFRGPALRQIQISLQQAAIRHVFTRPSMAVELWRERSFALIQDGEQISGTFDRVQIERDAAGVVMRALLVELKSDASRIAADQAATLKRAIPQVQLYRIALMKLLHLSAAHVSCQVVLLTKGMVIDVPPAG